MERLGHKPDAKTLRRLALERLEENPRSELKTEVAVRRLLHELQIRQVELEIQNALALEREVLFERILSHSSTLLDFAPLALLSLMSTGYIETINSSGAKLLGIDLVAGNKNAFVDYVASAEVLRWGQYLSDLTDNSKTGRHEIDLTLRHPRDGLFRAKLIGQLFAKEGRDDYICLAVERLAGPEISGSASKMA